MMSIPLAAVPSQTLTTVLSGQPCRLNIYQKSTGLFLDLLVNDALVLGGVLCRNGVGIVRDAYLGFLGDLVFYDTQGDDDPTYDGLGERFILGYVTP
jgi:hypothetical protein